MARNKTLLFLAVVALALALASALPVVQHVEQKVVKLGQTWNVKRQSSCPLVFDGPCYVYDQFWNGQEMFRELLYYHVLCPGLGVCPVWLERIH